MKYETVLKRREQAQELAKAMVAKAKARSIELNLGLGEGEVSWAFVAGYLESVLATVAGQSPASMKALSEQIKY